MAPDPLEPSRQPERRALVPAELLCEGAITLPPAAAKHLAVLRLKPGARIELLDGQGRRADATLTSANTANVGPPSIATGVEPSLALTLLFAVLKGDASDRVIRACTELGVRTFAPVFTERTVAHPKANRLERWRRIADSATLQCGRHKVPEILAVADLPAALAALDSRPDAPTGLRLAPWVPERSAPFPRPSQAPEPRGAVLLIGPEGGLTDAEAELARAHAFQTVTLGPRVLRAPTAAISATALLLSGS